MKTWLNVAEGAEYAGLSRDTIYTACERSELRHARVGGRRSIRLKPEWIDAWLERYARGAQEQRPAEHGGSMLGESDTSRRKEERTMGLLQDLQAQGTCARSLRARMVGQLSRQAGEPGEMDEPRDQVQG